MIFEPWNYPQSGCKRSSGWEIPRHCQTNAWVQTRLSAQYSQDGARTVTPRHLPKRKQAMNRFHVWYTMDPNVCTMMRCIGIQWRHHVRPLWHVCQSGCSILLWRHYRWSSCSIFMRIHLQEWEENQKYLDELDKYFVDHKINSRIDLLVEEAPHLTRNQLKWRYEGLDMDITCCMLAAECKVWPYQTFKYEWSQELDKAGYCLRYWECDTQTSRIIAQVTRSSRVASCEWGWRMTTMILHGHGQGAGQTEGSSINTASSSDQTQGEPR